MHAACAQNIRFCDGADDRYMFGRVHMLGGVRLELHVVDCVRWVGRHLRRVHIGIQLRRGGVPARRV